MALGSELACECAGAGDTMQCLADNVDKEFICAAYGLSGLPNFTNPLSVLAVAYPPIGVPAAVAYELYYGDDANPFCNTDGGTGQLNLVCCKYNPDQLYCHSGFPGEYVANCLGAPPPFQPQQFGPVQFPGVGCSHIPQCVPGGVADQSSASQGQRTGVWFGELSEAYAAAAYGAPGASQCDADFATMVGCQDWIEVARAGSPYLALQDADTPTPEQEAALQQDLFGIAAQRVMYALPHGLARYEYVSSRLWSDADKAAYLGSVDPDAELAKWMTPCGIELLKSTMPATWELMTVPMPNEDPPDKDDALDWADGCLAGRPPRALTIAVTLQGQDATVDAAVDDPEMDLDALDVNPLSIAWGDDSVTGEIFDHAAASNRLSHTYGASGTYRASLSYINDAGLPITREVSITVP
ncbi:MAG: hypothetical protein AAGA68_24650 [Pseudomonadota bacterium]